MFSINEFENGRIVAAYTADSLPAGQVVSREGNAVRMVSGSTDIIVSRPRAQGDIAEVFEPGELDGLPSENSGRFF